MLITNWAILHAVERDGIRVVVTPSLYSMRARHRRSALDAASTKATEPTVVERVTNLRSGTSSLAQKTRALPGSHQDSRVGGAWSLELMHTVAALRHSQSSAVNDHHPKIVLT